jgi:hypothetical protein
MIQYKLGDFIVFRYESPNKKKMMFSPPRNIMVLSPNYMGHLHGIKIDGLTPVEQESIQRLLQASLTNPQNFLEPFKAQMEMRKRELDILNAQRNELIKNGQKVVITPSNNSFLGLKNKAKDVLGSIIGKIKTFGRTPAQMTPATQLDPRIQQRLQLHDQMMAQKKMELDAFFANIQQQEQALAGMQKVPTNPYEFYHRFFKGFIGNSRRMKMIYRKFEVSLIKTPRLVKTVGIVPNG